MTEYKKNNVELTKNLCSYLKFNKNKCPIVYSSTNKINDAIGQGKYGRKTLRKILHDDKISNTFKNKIGEYIYRNDDLIENPNQVLKLYKIFFYKLFV
jgi:hypothetical protein